MLALALLGCGDVLVLDVDAVDLGTMSVVEQPDAAWVTVLNTAADPVTVEVAVDHPFLTVDLAGSATIEPNEGLLFRILAVRDADLFPTAVPGRVTVSGGVEPLVVTVALDVECDHDGDGRPWWRCGGDDDDDSR